MLVLLAPSFAGGDADYQRLSKVTGMLAYDLRTRLKPGTWGLVKALADENEAQRLGTSLSAGGFPIAVVARDVASDPARPIVELCGLGLSDRSLSLELRERTMDIPLSALCCIVRGEAQVGKGTARSSGGHATSSSTFRAVVPSTSDLQVFRETAPPTSFEAFAAADLHFHSVTWIARIDARSFDFRSVRVEATSPAAALDELVDRLGQLTGARVDRAVRASSVASFTQQSARAHAVAAAAATGAQPQYHRSKEIAGDDRFDPYSRVIGEAERQLAARRQQNDV